MPKSPLGAVLNEPLRPLWSAPATYAFSAVALVAALLLRYLLDPWLQDHLPFVTMFGGVAAAAWLGGYRTGAAAAVLGYIGCLYFFIPPRGTLVLTSAADAVGLIAYFFTCTLVIVFAEAVRRAQVSAIERGQLLQVTLRSIGDAVITTDVTGRITYMNGVAESLTGWSLADASDQPLSSVFRIVNEDTRATVESPATRALREGVVVGLANHTILIRKDGRELAIDDSAAPIRDEFGRVGGCVLIFRDVSEHRRSQRDKASQLLTARVLASIIESSDDAIVSKSLEGIVQSWNAAAERLFGYRAEEAVGRHISLIIPPERLAEEDHIIANLKAGRRIEHFETERVAADGRRLLVSLTISPIKDASGNVVGASKIVRDVTRQRLAERRERQLLAEAAQANAKFHALFEQGALFATIIDVNGVILDANRFSWEGSGYPREQVVGKEFWQGPWWIRSPQLADQIKAATLQARQGQAFHGELPYFLGDGRDRIADVTIQPIHDDTGEVLFLAATAIDITERKRLEDDLRTIAADLSEANRRKNEFLAMLAHELRNPLAPISNAVRALRVGIADPEALKWTANVLDRQVRQLARLVDDLLDVSRISRGHIELRKERVEVQSVVAQAVEAVQALYADLNHQLTIRLPDDPLYVDADPARLAQVIGNLLNNACKFTEKGGHVRLTIEAEGNEIAIRVADDGIGIAAADLPRLFDMFVQVDTSLERSRDGLGIGLTLVKTLVQMHGGSVGVQSDGPGSGSEFTVRLPAARDAAHTAMPEPTPAVAPSVRRLLVVDDNKDSAESLALLLRLGGHDTHTAHDGLEAITAAERLRPDAVLLDIGLPRMNGYEVCSRIRKMPWGSNIVFVALTGWGQEEDRERSKDAGFDAHLVKPLDYDALLQLLKSLPPNRGRSTASSSPSRS